jgi:serine/threonine-protein kinase
MGFLDKIKSFFDKPKVLDIPRRFEILRDAITGTMSDFHVVREIQTGKILGLKLLDIEKTEQLESRFKGLNKPPEGEIAMAIKHPLIVETLEYGLTTTGQQYVVMEYVKGVNLHVLIANRDASLEGKKIKLIRMMAEAIEAVHVAGYIHRDICPRNFIYHAETESLKLIDFGLSVPFTREFTQPGNRTGTPQYMAPEVVRRRPTDQRIDIFSLGVSAYQLCTYELPWTTNDATGKAALAHDTLAPTPILEYRPKLNRTLAETIMSCLSSNPDQRPESVTKILNTIRKVKADDEK